MKISDQHYFVVFVGSVGSGKTFAMAHYGIEALKRGEVVFCSPGVYLDPKNLPGLENTPVFSSPQHFDKEKHEGAAVVYFQKPLDVLSTHFRCGTLLWDELGATVNNRESDVFPFGLTIKLIHLRKFHLQVFASVQNDEMADKNIRRFYNAVFKCSEIHVPLLGLIKKAAVRPPLICKLPHCAKNAGLLTKGDVPGHFPWYATFYRLYHIDPSYSQNKEKHHSKGSIWLPFSAATASAYQSATSVMSEANVAYQQAIAAAANLNRWKRRGLPQNYRNDDA